MIMNKSKESVKISGLEMDSLAADLFVSEMILDPRMGGRRIRILKEHHLIHTLRDIYTISMKQIPQENRHLLYSEEWANIGLCLKDDRKKAQAEFQAATCRSLGICSVNQDDNSYPLNLRVLEGMPLVLYWKGDLSILGLQKMPAVAVVGSRQPTVYLSLIHI